MEQSLKMGYDSRNKMGNIPNYGPSIRYIEYAPDLSMWVAHCDEYATIIKYCPFCGEEL